MEKEVIAHFTSGMLTVPQDLQASLRLREGSQLLLRVENGELIAHPLVSEPIDIEKALAVIESFRGIFARRPGTSDEVPEAQSEHEEHDQSRLDGNLIPQPTPEDDLDALAGSLPALRGAVEELALERSQLRW